VQIKAVFHIDEVEKWKLLIGNVQNLMKGITDQSFEIEIVATSVAVKEYLKKQSLFSHEFEELSGAGVRVCACRNSLNGLKINQDEILELITIVPVGVKELIEKQLEGFAYVKP